MAGPLVPDVLWEAIEPLLPPEPPKPNGGRPRVPARAVLGGILFVLRSGIPWQRVPQELGCGSGMTCWRDSGIGRHRAYGSICTERCSVAFMMPDVSTGSESAGIAPASAQGKHQAPPGGGPQRDSALDAPQRGKRA